MASSILARMAVIIDGQTASFNKAMAQSQGQLAGFQKSIGAVSATLLATFGTAALFNGISDAVGIMADFERTMSEVKAITGATGAEFKALERDALQLGASTKFTATEVGQLQIAFGRLGFNTKEILDATEATLALAAATGEDLAKSADVAGSTVRGFGLKAKETQRVVDVMAKSFNTTALGLENFTESMKYVAPVAAASNLSLEETTALLGTLADAGIRGSMAGTSLRKILTDLPNDSRPFQERLEELSKRGITLRDSMDEVGRTAQTALLILTKNNDKTKELAASFQNVAGEAEKMARIMQDNLTGDVEKLTSAWEGLILAVGQTDFWRRGTQGLTAFLNVLSGTADQDEALKNLVRGIQESSASATEQFIKDLKAIRKEAGKPIDLNLVNELAEKYKLTDVQANKLYSSLLQVNEALSFQETVIREFQESNIANKYGETTEAINLYKQGLYDLILAQQIEIAESKRLSAGTNVFDAQIKDAENLIASSRRAIAILNEYSKDFSGSQKEISEETKKVTLSLKYYQDKLKDINHEFDITDKNDLTKLRNLAALATGYELVILRLEKLKSLGDLDFRLIAPDVSTLLDPISKVIEKTRSGLTFEVDVTMSEAMIKRFEEGLKRLKQSTETTTAKIEQAFVNLGPLITNALAGIGEALGNALAGTADFGEEILKVVANFGKQLGQILIAEGVALLAAKFALKNPYTAIAAGVALVAISSALTSGISKAHASTIGGGGSLSSAQTSSGFDARATDAQDVRLSSNVVIRGQDMYILLSNYENNNKYTKAGG